MPRLAVSAGKGGRDVFYLCLWWLRWRRLGGGDASPDSDLDPSWSPNTRSRSLALCAAWGSGLADHTAGHTGHVAPTCRIISGSSGHDRLLDPLATPVTRFGTVFRSAKRLQHTGRPQPEGSNAEGMIACPQMDLHWDRCNCTSP